MHHPCMAVMRVSASKSAVTTPYCLPPTRRILYAARFISLIFPLGCTVKMCSEYNITASVLSSCSGSGTFTSACIHPGASFADAAVGPSNRQNTDTPPSNAATWATPLQRQLVGRRNAARLDHDLLFITGLHHLEKFPQRAVIFCLQHERIDVQIARQVQRPVLVLRSGVVRTNFSFVLVTRRNAVHLPVQRKLNGHVIDAPSRKIKINRVHPVGMFEHMLFGRAKESHRDQRAVPCCGSPTLHLNFKFT